MSSSDSSPRPISAMINGLCDENSWCSSDRSSFSPIRAASVSSTSTSGGRGFTDCTTPARSAMHVSTGYPAQISSCCRSAVPFGLSLMIRIRCI